MENPNCSGADRLAEVAAVYPAWYVWEGVIAGVLYARRPLSSPPRVVRASSVAGLMQAIEADETAHGERTPGLP